MRWVHDLVAFNRLSVEDQQRVFGRTRADSIGQAAFYGQDDPGWVLESDCDLRVGGVWTVTFGPSRTACTATGTSSK